MTNGVADEGSATSLGALTAALLDSGETDRVKAGPTTDPIVPGVGGPAMGLREALRQGGIGTVGGLMVLAMIVEFDASVLTVLGPDIQRSLGVSDTVLGAIVGASGALTVLGGVPLGVLADRWSRLRLVAIATLVWAGFAALGAATRNGFALFLTRTGVGFGQSYQVPIPNPVLADQYPIEARGAMIGLHASARSFGSILGPLLAGGVAAIAGGAAGWRWAMVVPAAMGVAVAVAVARLPEPTRGAGEQRAVLGEELAPVEELPVSVEAAFARLRKIRTFYSIVIGVSALGFGMFAAPLLISLDLENRAGYDAGQRAIALAAMAVGPLLSAPFAGRLADRFARRSPTQTLLFAASMIACFGVVTPLALLLPGVVPVLVGLAVGQAFAAAGFVAMAPATALVLPYRLRSQGFAMFGVYLFLFGAFGGLVIGGALSDAFGERFAIAVLTPTTALIGAALIARGAIHVNTDVAMVVEELAEERQERQRLSLDPERTPVLHIRNLDASYGPVQVLFDVGFEVHRGETVALLGTNGAGKSTVLRAVSGLHVPDRGVIRLDGRTITFTEPELRFRLGVIQVRGGAGIFPGLTVRDNLRAFQLGSHRSRAATDESVERVLGLFPSLAERIDVEARHLSGGQRQMLALAVAVVHEPRLLIIDELSLGLAPVVVQDLLGVLRTLKANGVTMLIVEQSLNVALSIADRAVFMEKGAVRFEGNAADLATRDDLVRAVFLGGDGG